PIEVVLAIAEELRAGGIARPRLGAEFDDVSPQLALASGRAPWCCWRRPTAWRRWRARWPC
ncbi:MAG: hypothetical protein KA335_12680, partial [Ramlibacter sp.]|nr:hypothetical protein [Ramlibacter sp.]